MDAENDNDAGINKNSNFDALIKESSSIIDDLLKAIIIK